MHGTKGIPRRNLVGIVFALFFAFATAAQDPFTIESPSDGAAYPEFGSVALKVSVHFGDGTLRWFAEAANDYSRILLYTNHAPPWTFETQLTNLPPGNYNIPLTTRLESGDFFTNYVRFIVTNRTRSVPKYTFTILPGGTNTRPARINNKGQIVGVSDRQAFLYDGEMHFLGLFGGVSSEAKAINNNGEVVGVAEDSQGVKRPFYWDASVGMQPLPVNGATAAVDINDRGDVIVSGDQSALVYPNGNFISLPVGGFQANSYRVIAAGESGAYKVEPTGPWNEFLGLFKHVFGEDGVKVGVVAINDANELTGYDYSTVGGGRNVAVYGFRYRALHRERISPFNALTWAQSINRIGDVVGWTSNVYYGPHGVVEKEEPPHAFIAPRDGFAILNKLVPDRKDTDIVKAFWINDRREIIGMGTNSSGSFAVVLRPIPEFQSIAFDQNAGKITATVDGFISTRVKVETSANLNDWSLHSVADLNDETLKLELPAGNGSTFLRVTRQ
jgi:probable HAF family extracellular repeat protein